MFEKILIANRGEIACRVAVTARKLGIRTVAVYSDADANAKHVAMCDEAVHIGASTVRDSYLQWQRIIDVAKSTGAQAIHPGYGFLSENPEFAAGCVEHGLVFIGPPAASIRAMGLKAESKRLMDQAGVPLVPGYHGNDQSTELLQSHAQQIGYPVLIKASAGGGGRGMRVVHEDHEFIAALESCKREALNSFGNDAVLIEKYVQRPRHIEIQVFADAHGNCVHLFERDCSVQRRHQKVLEEAPAPGLTEQTRQRMGQAAVEAARAVGYVGAGTVEFIVEQPDGYDNPESMRFYFMEMNTRLQVEHPVTEAITGLDLVQWQLLVAAGKPLPLRQEQIKMVGHAIEARICAENPDKQFLPATGTLAVYRKPAHRAFGFGSDNPDLGVRFDDGVREGDTISPYYDSMIAKLIVHGQSREQALAGLDAALSQTHIVGLANNVQFLRRIVGSESFAHAKLDTALIDRESAVLFDQDSIHLTALMATVVAHTVLTERAGADADPFSARDGFSLYGPTSRQFEFEYRSQLTAATLIYSKSGALQLQVGEAVGELSFEACGDNMSSDTFFLVWQGQRQPVTVYAQGEVLTVFTRDGAAEIKVIDRLAHAAEGSEDGGRLTAPMPGSVVSFAVKAGDVVKKGQPLAVIEAMKMEHTIVAPADGLVLELLYGPGDQVLEGDELLKLDASATMQ